MLWLLSFFLSFFLLFFPVCFLLVCLCGELVSLFWWMLCLLACLVGYFVVIYCLANDLWSFSLCNHRSQTGTHTLVPHLVTELALTRKTQRPENRLGFAPYITLHNPVLWPSKDKTETTETSQQSSWSTVWQVVGLAASNEKTTVVSSMCWFVTVVQTAAGRTGS